jgi:hypothetical protein
VLWLHCHTPEQPGWTEQPRAALAKWTGRPTLNTAREIAETGYLAVRRTIIMKTSCG